MKTATTCEHYCSQVAVIRECSQACARRGWVLGGEFALYYLVATVVNEVADCMFVVPTTTANGWRCKIFSIALEFAQLGVLAPAAVFNHNPCASGPEVLLLARVLTAAFDQEVAAGKRRHSRREG